MTIRIKFVGKPLMVAGALCLLGSVVATAQTSETAAPPAGADDNSLGEIMVTAQRRSEHQQDVPISITAISAAELTQTDARQLSDIQQITPGLRFDNNGAFSQPTIRGVGTAIATSGGGADVGIYIDGFYSPNPLSADSQLLNVDGVQVLKGPQGTLFGRNTTGGAILITTSKPSQDTSAVVQATYGRFNTQQYEGYATTGITDQLAVDIEGVVNTGNGYVHNIVTLSDTVGSYDNWSARVGVKYDPVDNLSFLFHYQHSVVNDPTSELGGSYTVNGVPQSIPIPGSVSATQPSDVANTRPAIFNSTSDVLQLTSTLTLPFAVLTSYTQGRWDTSQSYINQDYSSASYFALSIPVYNRTLSQEFLLASTGDSKLQWTTGAFFFDNSDQWSDVRLTLAGSPLTEFTSSGTDTRSYATFADLTYEALKDFFVTVGARYSHDEVLAPYYTVNAVSPDRIYLDPVKNNTVTPRAVLRYKVNDDSSVYASFSKGYKAAILNVGGGTSVADTPAGLAQLRVSPETIKAYEVGYKFAQGPLSADIAAYHYDYSNLQVASYIGTASLINNAASAKIDGLEGQIRYRFVRWFDVNAGVNYMNARYDNYPNATFYTEAGGVFVPVSGDASGNEMQRAPRLTGNVGARYSVDVGGGEGALSANVYHTSKVYFVASNQYQQDGYTTLDLRAEWTDPSKRYTVALFGDNVTNQRYITQVPIGNFGIGAIWNYPVTYGISARAKF